MNAPSQPLPNFASFPSWAERLDAFRSTPWLAGCLESIRDEADRKRDGEWSAAAQYALDTLADGAEDALADLDWLIAEADREERAPALAWWQSDADRIAQGYQAGRS